MSAAGSTKILRNMVEGRYRRRLQSGMLVGSAVAAFFGVRSWLALGVQNEMWPMVGASAVLAAVVVGLALGMPARWGERAGCAVLVCMTSAVLLLRGQFAAALLLWNALIPLGIATSDHGVRRELWVWTGVIVVATLGCYAATTGFDGASRLEMNQLLSLVTFFPTMSGIAWMYVRDRQHLKQKNGELERRRRIGAKLESIGRLAGGVAHDFNNLLTIISNHAQVLQEGSAFKGEGSEDALASITAAADRGRQLTRQLTAVGGRGVRAPVALYPTELVNATLAPLKRSLPENVRLVSRVESDGWATSADPGDLEHVVGSLVLNARDAMPEGGEIEVRCRNAVVDRRRDIDDPDVRPGRYVEIVVSDSGEGMSTDLMDQIFDPFFTTKDLNFGTGLGLTRAYQAIRKLGGDITVLSSPGRGSRFSVYLPACDESRDLLERGRHARDRKDEPITVLLVEDEPAVRMATGLLLRARGFDLIVAQDGKEAISAFERHGRRIDVVLTDFMMPGLSGVEVARQIRKIDPRVGIVFTSGYADDPEIEEFVAREGAKFVHKPFSADDLVAAITEVRRRRGVRGIVA